MATIISLLPGSRPVQERSARKGSIGAPARDRDDGTRSAAEDSTIYTEIARGITGAVGSLAIKGTAIVVVTALISVGSVVAAIVGTAWYVDDRFFDKIDREIGDLKENDLARVSSQIESIQSLQNELENRTIELASYHNRSWSAGLRADTFKYAYVERNELSQYIQNKMLEWSDDVNANLLVVFYENQAIEFSYLDNAYLDRISSMKDFWFVSGSSKFSPGNSEDATVLERDIKKYVGRSFESQDKILMASSDTTENTVFSLPIAADLFGNDKNTSSKAYQRLSKAREEARAILRGGAVYPE